MSRAAPRRPARAGALRLERRRESLLSRSEFLRRQLGYALVAVGMVVVSLAVGVVGYRASGHLSWIDALLNASFILTGMGPVDPMRTVGGKLFSSAYAVFSGVAFLSTIGVLLTPIVHRFMHRFHLAEDDDDDEDDEDPASK